MYVFKTQIYLMALCIEYSFKYLYYCHHSSDLLSKSILVIHHFLSIFIDARTNTSYHEVIYSSAYNVLMILHTDPSQTDYYLLCVNDLSELWC